MRVQTKQKRVKIARYLSALKNHTTLYAKIVLSNILSQSPKPFKKNVLIAPRLSLVNRNITSYAEIAMFPRKQKTIVQVIVPNPNSIAIAALPSQKITPKVDT